MNHQRPFALRSLCFALFLFALCALPFAAHAQTATATLSGTVTDQNGAVVPSTNVTIVSNATGLKRDAVTNDEGNFTVPLLQPGAYTVRAHHDGFKIVQIDNVVLNVGDQKTLQIPLQTGDVSETVNITGEAPLINDSPAVATTIDRQFVGNLPLNGRSFQSLILLTPGVTVTSASLVSDAGQFSVNGQRASTNYFTVDGVSANVGISTTSGGATNLALTGAYPGTSAFGSTNNLVSVDALEEYRIQTSTYTAEFGRQPGGQIALVTRSGANQVHGTLFDYLRNEVLDARDYFNKKPAPKPPLRQNDFGVTFSGPIWKNKTFFFFSYEGLRLRLPAVGITQVPSLRVRAAAAAALKPILNAFALPTGPELLNGAGQPTGAAPYAYSFSNQGRLDATSIRIDHNFNSKFTLFGRFNEAPSTATTFFPGAYGVATISSTRTLTVGATWVLSSRLNNELRVNSTRQLGQQHNVPGDQVGGAVPVDPALLTNGLGGQGSIDFNFGWFGGIAGGDFSKNYQRQMNLVDNVSLVKGSHQFKIGIDYRRLSPTYGIQDLQNVGFDDEAAVNSAVASSVTILKRDSARPRFTNFSAYGQDTWKVTPRLTLDLGLRWEFNPAPSEAEGKMPVVVLGITGNPPDVSKATLAPTGTPFYNPFYTSFAPRFGVAYQLRKTPGRETVLRGGFGVYYDLGSAAATGGYPLTASKSLTNRPFPLSVADAARPPVLVPTSLPVTVLVRSNEQGLRLPYTLQWNFAVEQSLGNQVVSLSYVAAAARQQLTTQSLNPRAGNTTGPRPNPNFSTIIATWNGPTSDYHSLQAQYRARFTRGLQALVNYTWSHAIDEVSSDLGTGILERGNADFDVRHNLSGALTYELPSPKITPVLKHLFGNWSIAGIVHVQSGRPVNVTGVTTIVDGAAVSLRPNYVQGQPLYISDPTVPGGRRFNAAAFTNPPVNPNFPSIRQQGSFGRNVFRELPIYQVDMALGRSFKLRENLKLQFKGELFNILNHPMFSGYGTSFTTPATFGVPVRTLTSGLGGSGPPSAGLSGLYQIGGPRSVQLSLKLAF